MREITINGVEFEIRPLKRKEVKEMRKKGMPLTTLSPDLAEQAMESVFEMVFTPEQIEIIDELDNPDSLKLWNGILKETYGDKGEEKNLKRSGG